MIAAILRDLRWRLLALLPLAGILYFFEPGFHQHDEFSIDAVALGPVGVSATLSYLAALSMVLLLGGSISGDRREGYTRLFFSHPTSPIGYYGLRWALAYAISVALAFLFLVVGQVVAWGSILGGWSGLLLPALSALVYGGLVAFLSVLLNRADGWIAFLLFFPTFVPEVLNPLDRLIPAIRQPIMMVIPPQGAFIRIWEGLLYGVVDWAGILFAVGYGVLLLLAAGLILLVREWP
jgi:hypothetical protein